MAELTAAGATKVFHEKVSGATSDHAALKRAVASVQAGDVLLVTRLDQLARSTRDLLNILDDVAKRGAGFRSLRDAWADTMTPHSRLMLTVLGGLAEFERELILARTGEGRQRARNAASYSAASTSILHTSGVKPWTVASAANPLPTSHVPTPSITPPSAG